MALATGTLAGCSPKEEPATAAKPTDQPSGEVVVFAAASLTDVFGQLAGDFEREHPGIKVTTNFAGSQSLRTQIENGAQAQVFASASVKHIDSLRASELVAAPVVFATNRLVIVVPPKNPAGITSLADLPKAERLVLAGESVPAGTYADKVIANAAATLGSDFPDRVAKKLVSRETHVRQTLQKVVLGEADAALVYATDAASVGDKVEVIAIPDEVNVIAEYPIAVVKGGKRSDLGQLFVDFVLSEAGREKLADFGFGTPGGKATAP